MASSHVALLTLALASGASMAQPADPSSVLTELARMLADARADAAKARSAKCPAKTAALVGLPLGQILIELGQPEGPQGADAVTYLPRAGGPQLTFRFNNQGTVSAVDCRAAK